jgi:hypothetical protein
VLAQVFVLPPAGDRDEAFVAWQEVAAGARVEAGGRVGRADRLGT